MSISKPDAFYGQIPQWTTSSINQKSLNDFKVHIRILFGIQMIILTSNWIPTNKKFYLEIASFTNESSNEYLSSPYLESTIMKMILPKYGHFSVYNANVSNLLKFSTAQVRWFYSILCNVLEIFTRNYSNFMLSSQNHFVNISFKQHKIRQTYFQIEKRTLILGLEAPKVIWVNDKNVRPKNSKMREAIK